jgi:hypothetical protein
MTVSATIILTLGLGHREAKKPAASEALPLVVEEADSIIEPV